MLYILKELSIEVYTVKAYLDKPPTSDGILDIEISRNKLGLIIWLFVLSIFSKGLKATSTSMILVM